MACYITDSFKEAYKNAIHKGIEHWIVCWYGKFASELNTTSSDEWPLSIAQCTPGDLVAVAHSNLTRLSQHVKLPDMGMLGIFMLLHVLLASRHPSHGKFQVYCCPEGSTFAVQTSQLGLRIWHQTHTNTLQSRQTVCQRVAYYIHATRLSTFGSRLGRAGRCEVCHNM
jgi:hypothetical protein